MAGFDPNRYGAKKSKNYIATQTKTEEPTVSTVRSTGTTFDPNTYGSGYSKNYTARHATRSVETNGATTRQAETAQDNDQNFLSRAWKTITGGLKGSAAGNMDTMGVAYQAGQGGRTQQNTQGLKDAQWALARAKRAYEQDKSPASAAELSSAMTAMKAYATVLGDGAYDQALKAAYNVASQLDTGDMNALYESLGKVQVDPNTGVQQKATEAARDLAAQVQQSGARDIERAKTGLGTFGQMVVDAGASMAQMGGDLAANALLGTTGSMIPFAARAFGGGTMQARSEGADFGQQIAYGGALAGKEVLTEKMFNIALPFAKAYGGGALDDVTQKAIQTAVDKLGRTPAGKRALNAALQLTASGVSEGMEELIGDWMEWQMPRIYGGDVDTASETLANSLYDFVVGGMSGVAGSVITPGTYQYGNEAATVQENTAPEMDGRTAEAVSAVTRGETITGNQAAAIARDPVAVETLEASTGVKLDTEKPISQLKREIIALASRETAQEQTQAATSAPKVQKRSQKAVGGFMEAGQRAYQQVRETSDSGAEVYAGFSAMYNAGLNGVEADKAKGKYAAMLTPEQRYTAYNAGLEDARAQVARENSDAASVTTTAGAGLADNAYSRYIIAKDKGAASALNTIGKKLGVRIEFVDSLMDGQANGQYIREKNLIQIAADSTNPIYEVAGHEVTHRMQDLSPDEYRAFRQAAIEYRMRENGADTETEIVQRYMEAAERAGVTLTQDEVMDEIAADFAGRMIEDTDLFAQFAKDNRTAAQKLLDGLKEFIAKVKAMFTGKARDNAAMDAYGKTFGELEDIAQKWQAAFDAAERQAEKTKTAAGEGDGAKYQIKQFPNGMKYVQADRQVLFGNDPKAWSEQLEIYINGKIRNHEDVRLIAEDGDILLLTSKSAGKLSSIYDNNGRTLDEKAFERKANAAAHIDELIKVSERGGKTVLDFGGRHGDMAKDGWNYRTAYFMDFDGKYYRTRISVALGKDGSIVYNIGEMQERSTPQINGSSGNSGAQRGNASGTSIPADGENVNRKFQLRSTADIEQEVRDLKRERTALASRNRALEQRVQELKGEMRISKEPSVVARDVKKLGRETIRKYGSDVKYGDIQADMEALGKAVMKKDVSMADLMPYARNAATAIVDNTTELTEHGAELLEIKDYLKRQKILFNGEMDHYNEFRKRYMGTLKLNKSEGLPVDTMYEEMTEMFGEGYFPSDVYTEADKLQQIADVLDSMDSIYENPFDSYRDAAIQEIANDIIDGMISDQVRQKKTFADRRELEKQEAVGRVREMLTKEREKRRDMVKRMRREYSEKTQKGREKRYAAEMRAKIARHTGPLSEKLLRPTDKKHIPEELRVTVASLLKNINLESAYSYDENGRLRKNAGGDPTKRTMQAEKLRRLYEDIIDRDDDMVVDPALTEGGGLLASLSKLGDKRIADMNVTELETVWNAVRAIEATLTSYDRTLANQKYARTSEWADSLMMGSMSRKRRNRKISLDMADPYTFFSAYGDGGMQVYRTLRNAQDREHVMLTELREAAKKFLDADVYKNRFERHTFTTSRGVELTLTNEQIMNLYNLAKRGEQAMNHLMVGGIVQPEIKRDGKLKAIPRGTENILLGLEDVRAITSVLTPEQIKVADGLQKLASTKLAEWGNEASMTVYGYRKFMEEHYWPIKTAKEATASSVEKGPDIAREIKNMGSAKALTPNASNALDIGGVYDVFAQNASDMIKYATLLAPMEDINRLYNYRYRDSMGNLTGRNVRQVLSSVYGDAAQKYWRNLMRDVQNGQKKSGLATARVVEKYVGSYKGAAVGANWRVVIQQPTAYFRAAVVLDPENMAKGLGNGVTKGNGWDKARKWAPIAGIKDTSGFDQGSRYTIAREVYGTDGSFMSWLSDKSMSLAGKADAMTWGKIWNACEWQVAANTSLEVGSDAYYQQVAEVFTDVIDQTQVVDGIMQRTQIMRDGDMLFRQATSFMGEPLKSLNILMRSYDAWVYETNPQKRSNALKQLKRAVCALLVTDVVNALAQSIVDGLRDDDKEKKYLERVLEAFTGVTGDEKDGWELTTNIALEGNLKGNITLLGRVPFGKDVISLLQGYTVDRMDASVIDDIIKATRAMIASANGEGKKTMAYSAKQVIASVSKVFGISVANAGRDVWSLARTIASETGNVRLMFEMEKAIYRMDKSAGNKKRWCELLYRAQKDRDTETARLIYREMLAHGYEEADVRQGVEAIMKQEQGVNSVKELRNRWMAP